MHLTIIKSQFPAKLCGIKGEIGCLDRDIHMREDAGNWNPSRVLPGIIIIVLGCLDN